MSQNEDPSSGLQHRIGSARWTDGLVCDSNHSGTEPCSKILVRRTISQQCKGRCSRGRLYKASKSFYQL
ncbi:uncharacterized protein A1O9_04756 [Exophiala aquamarina CBS 119918]|uniref:Uncharacterized protein n=1 Tax=Exophiala aquamarina CBS 119918 TaxID=1182545 RepID=A0A072PKP6_9EURO|nr:uncharacterized protein A1O9_04756 [Exophiala aquamarina CBS 119918]KEF59908.1 hypothetical protein A1O9_04756 [Exophiala aquamarina CBS 119918]